MNIYIYGQYAATLSIACRLRAFRKSDFILLGYLGEKIKSAFQRHSKLIDRHVLALEKIVNDLLNCLPVDESRIHYALDTSAEKSHKFYCFTLMMPEKAYGMPTEYICQVIKNLLSGCFSVEHDFSIVSFVSFMDNNYYEESIKKLEKFLNEMNFQAGISNVFEDLVNARYYFRQASCAINMGRLLDSERLTYKFSEYVLSYMVQQSAGEFPVEFVCPEGLIKLKKGDFSTVDYWQTLCVYVRNGMNAVQTAKDLFLHRSTVLHRLSRISQILQMDLNDYEHLQYLTYCINLMEMFEKKS